MPRLNLPSKVLAVLILSLWSNLMLLAEGSLSKYSLNLKVLDAMAGDMDMSFRDGPLGPSREPSTLAPLYYGKGQGNLLLPSGVEGVDFQYIKCLSRISPLSTRTSTIPARWMRNGKTLEVLVPYSRSGTLPDPKKVSLTKCTLDLIVHDYVFVPVHTSMLNVTTRVTENYGDQQSQKTVRSEYTSNEKHGMNLPRVSLTVFAQDSALKKFVEKDIQPRAADMSAIVAEEDKTPLLSSRYIRQFVGTYDFPSDTTWYLPTQTVEISTYKQGLDVAYPAEPRPLFYEGMRHKHPLFFNPADMDEFEFVPDSNGLITSLILVRHMTTYTAKRR